MFNAVRQPNIWLQKDSVDGVDRRQYMFTYGDNGLSATVYGKLYERDFGPWLCMLDWARQNEYKPVESEDILVDIAREMGYTKNPWQKIPALWETFDRLLDVQIRIRPETGQGFTAKFCLIEGWLDSDGRNGSFAVSQYREIVNKFILGEANVSKKTYLQIRSMLSRSLYRLLCRQQKFYYGHPYEIRMSLLLQYLNYDSKGLPWYKLRGIVKSAAEELKRIEFLHDYTIHTNRCKAEGGVITFFLVMQKKKEINSYPDKKEISQPDKKQITTSKQNITFAQNRILQNIQIIRDTFEDKIEWSDEMQRTLESNISKLKVWCDDLKRGPTIKTLIQYYCQWLDEKDIKFIQPTLFTQGNSFFKTFVKKEVDNENIEIKTPFERRLKAKRKAKPVTLNEHGMIKVNDDYRYEIDEYGDQHLKKERKK